MLNFYQKYGKRIIDIIIASTVLPLLSVIILPLIIVVWMSDFCSPFYFAKRMGKGEREFTMVKFRTMVVNAEQTGVDSTSATDPRLTTIGRILRRIKLDEIVQFWNVLVGDMSLVGPRPNVKRETALYSSSERRLLTVKPGITDFSSIVFADLAEILKGSHDPNQDYKQLVRPWKSRLGLIYIENISFMTDMKILFLTLMAIFSRQYALSRICSMLQKLNVEDDIISVARRDLALKPCLLEDE